MDLRAPLGFFRDPLGRLDLCHTCVSYSITIALLMNRFPIGQGFEMHQRKHSLFPNNMRWVCPAYRPCCVLLPACCDNVCCPVVSEGRCHGRDSPKGTGTQISARARYSVRYWMSLILLRDFFLQPRYAYFFVTIDKYQFTHQSSVSYKCRFSCADSFSLAN